MGRITPEKQARFRQYWIDGFTIPEIAKMCGSTTTTVKKYLGREIEVYLKEHTEARDRREKQQRISEIAPCAGTSTIMPTPVNLAEVVPEPQLDVADLPLDEFVTYIEFEFSECSDNIDYLEHLYRELKSDSLNYEQVMALRRVYESRLNNINKDIEVPSVDVVDQPAPSFTEGLQIKSAEQTQQTIKSFKSKHNISKLPIPRLSSLVDWDERRLYEHLIFWYLVHYNSRKAATAFVKDKTLEQYQEWFNSFE